MSNFCKSKLFAVLYLGVSSPLLLASSDDSLEEVRVWGGKQSTGDAGYVSPTSLLTAEDMIAINAATTEDLVKFEPSLVIRRRFIGDSNGTLGVRGSNMFQTARSMVFADGVPLHYLLQSRWSGAPRWTMVSASEIAQIEVIYGPFSAEYSGNAMGGVVLIETAIPQEREFRFDTSYFNQQFNAYGFDDNVDGFKAFASYGDKIGDTSLYFSVNHLSNTAQPQTFRDSTFTSSDGDDSVSGALTGNDSRGRARYWYGDTGVVETETNNFKLKIGHEFGAVESLLNIAFEDRHSENVGQSYIRDISGNMLWSGNDHIQDGQAFSINSGRLNASELDRESLSIGLRLKADVGEQSRIEANLNTFSILKDESRGSALNPADPNFTPAGQISEYNDSGWNTAEVKFVSEDFLTPGLELISGLRYEAYELNLDVFNSDNYLAGVKNEFTSRFGGETSIFAAYLQANWQITEQWDAAFGLRHESFESQNGYYDEDTPDTANFDLVYIPSESKTALSPKFSVGYRPQENWLFRYSLAKAFRFPIAEELFSQYEAYNTVAFSNPDLEPEEGLHHNVMIDRSFDHGYVRVNVFQESVENAIESQTDSSTNVRSFVPIDEVDVKGVEFIVNKTNALVDGLDLRFNVTWTDAEIVDNSTAEGENPENSIEGNVYPRMPKWRSNLLVTWHFTEQWDLSANLQYASDSYGRISNDDTEDNVYGAQDAYTRLGVKTSYKFDEHWLFSLGIDNLTNDVDYVAHPWPGRTLYLNASFEM